MVSNLNKISQLALQVPLAQTTDHGQISVKIDETFLALAKDTQITQNLVNSRKLGQRMKAGVQKLGTVCMEMIIAFGQQQQINVIFIFLYLPYINI